MPTHWLPWPVYAKATLVAAAGARRSPASVNVFSPSRNDSASWNTTPAR